MIGFDWKVHIKFTMSDAVWSRQPSFVSLFIDECESRLFRADLSPEKNTQNSSNTKYYLTQLCLITYIDVSMTSAIFIRNFDHHMSVWWSKNRTYVTVGRPAHVCTINRQSHRGGLPTVTYLRFFDHHIIGLPSTHLILVFPLLLALSNDTWY